jgi:hypothetical protein
MNRMERAALEHLREWHRYDRSVQAANDRLVDQQRRAAADRKAGHSPNCTLARCAPDCAKTTSTTTKQD